MLIHGWFEGFPYQMVCTIVNINIKQVKALFWSKMMKDFRVVNFTQHFWRRFKYSGMRYIHFFCVPLNLPPRCLPNSEKFLGGLTIPFLDLNWVQYSLLCTTEFASEVLAKFWKPTLWSDNSILDLNWVQYSPKKPLLLTLHTYS